MRKNKKRKSKPKYPNFELDWKINNLVNFEKALNEVAAYASRNTGCGKDVTVQEIVDADLYDQLSRGDKCRLGRAVSYEYEKGRYGDNLRRGEKKGATKTYHHTSD